MSHTDTKSSYTGTRWIIVNNEWIPIKWGPKQLVHWVPSKVGWDVDTIQSETTVDATVKRHIHLLNHLEEFSDQPENGRMSPKKYPKLMRDGEYILSPNGINKRRLSRMMKILRKQT